MAEENYVIDEKLVYVMCPKCKTLRKKVSGKFNIIKRGYERNGFARFFCTSCKMWFNEHTGDIMQWQRRF